MTNINVVYVKENKLLSIGQKADGYDGWNHYGATNGCLVTLEFLGKGQRFYSILFYSSMLSIHLLNPSNPLTGYVSLVLS